MYIFATTSKINSKKTYSKYVPPKTFFFLRTSQQTCTKSQTQITTNF